MKKLDNNQIKIIIAGVLFAAFLVTGRLFVFSSYFEKTLPEDRETSAAAASGVSEGPETAAETGTTEEPATEEPFDYDYERLFLGDSRTVGLSEYAPVDGALYFCTTGMTSWGIMGAKLDVNGIGSISYANLLTDYTFRYIYIMLGINESLDNPEMCFERFSAVVENLKERQPHAKIIIMANMHVTKQRSDTDSMINNANINAYNSLQKKLADNKTVFYIDANPLFDTPEGDLDTKFTFDSTHIFARHYTDWKNYILYDAPFGAEPRTESGTTVQTDEPGEENGASGADMENING